MTSTGRSKAVLALFAATLLLSPTPVRGQNDEPAHIPVQRFVAYDLAPELLNLKKVRESLEKQYPTELRESGIDGKVTLWMFVDEQGEVKQVSVHEASAYDAFNEAAQRVGYGLKFRPASNDGQPVGVWIMQQVTFDSR